MNKTNDHHVKAHRKLLTKEREKKDQYSEEQNN